MAFPLETKHPTSSLMPFVVAERWTWVDCDLEGYEGFRAEVRLNLTNGERQRLQLLLTDVDEKRQEIATRRQAKIDALRAAKDLEGADPIALGQQLADELEATVAEHETNTTRIREAITPYIRAWNAAEKNDAGEIVDAPAPAVAGLAAFAAVDQVMEGWLVKATLEAYRGGNGFRLSATKQSASGQPGSGRTDGSPAAKRRSTRPSLVS